MYDKDPLTGRKLLRPGLKLIGAKTRNRWRFYQYFPEHDIYFEPFLGTGGIVLGKPPSTIETVSDLCPETINYYEVVRDKPLEFWFEYSRKLPILLKRQKDYFEEMKVLVIEEQDPVQKAVYFYLITKVAWNGLWRKAADGTVNSSYCQTVKGRGFFTPDWFESVYKRVKNICFYEQDYRHTLAWVQEYNPDRTFVLLDPPYRLQTVYQGKKWKDADFLEFRKSLDALKCKWMVTINDEPFMHELFEGYNIHQHSIKYSASQTVAGRGDRPEIIVTNYRI